MLSDSTAISSPYYHQIWTLWHHPSFSSFFSLPLSWGYFRVHGMTHPVFSCSWFCHLPPTSYSSSAFIFISTVPAVWRCQHLRFVNSCFYFLPPCASSLLPYPPFAFLLVHLLWWQNPNPDSVMSSALSQARLEKEAHNHAGGCHLHLDWAFRTSVGNCSVVSWIRCWNRTRTLLEKLVKSECSD